MKRPKIMIRSSIIIAIFLSGCQNDMPETLVIDLTNKQDCSQSEICDDHKDNNCDGFIDSNDPACKSAHCQTSFLCEKQQGVCASIQARCIAGEMFCDYASMPQFQETEWICNDSVDNDCDGLTDIYDTDCQLNGTCLAGDVETKTCKRNDMHISYGVCETALMKCLNGFWNCDFSQMKDFESRETSNHDCLDNDCDGQIDENNQTFASAGDITEGNYILTYYYISEEKYFTGTQNTPIYYQPGSENDIYGYYDPDFVDELIMAGSGFTNDGTLLGINCIWAEFPQKCCEAQPDEFCFSKNDRAKYPWGSGAKGKITPFFTIAANPEILPYDSIVFIPELKGKLLPDNNGVHDGCVKVLDTGGAFLNNPELRIDFFVGLREIMQFALDTSIFPNRNSVEIRKPVAGECDNYQAQFHYFSGELIKDENGEHCGDKSCCCFEGFCSCIDENMCTSNGGVVQHISECGGHIVNEDNTNNSCANSQEVCCCKDNLCFKVKACECSGSIDTTDTECSRPIIPDYCLNP